MEDVVADFNSRHITACDGPITVSATPAGSGDSMRQILAGKIKPDIWSPAGRVWLTLIDDQWRQQHGSALIANGAHDTPSLVKSPVVIAMWKPEAEALGWPRQQIGWSDIAKLSTDPQGWADYGHSGWGDFKFGHTHPNYSNSGLDAIIAENYAATGKSASLTTADVTNAHTTDFVANVESSIIHYGDGSGDSTTGFFADEMFNKGPNYLSAAVMYENLVVEANDGKLFHNLKYPVVAIYPKEGTFYSDHPFAILQANWVTTEKQTSALAFRDFLLAATQQRKALQYGFRPANIDFRSNPAPLDSNHGVDPTQPQATLQVPPADVVNAIIQSWNQQKRKVDIMLVLDRSGSMNADGKIEHAKQGLIDFVNLLGDSDGLGLTEFSTVQQILTPVSDLGPKRQDVLNAIKSITASGDTLLYHTIKTQVLLMDSVSAKQRIKAVIVLTDGADTISGITVDNLITTIAPSANDVNAGEKVKVFTIAYGSDADVNDLKRIAQATGGQEYAGTPQNIQQVYQLISTFF